MLYLVLIARLIIKSTLSQALITFNFISGLFLCQTTNNSWTNDGPTSSIPVKSNITLLLSDIDGNNSLASERDIGYVVLKISFNATVLFSVILWRGNIVPQDDSRNNSPKMKQLMEYMARHHDDLLKTMTDEQKEIFEKFHDCWSVFGLFTLA